MATIIPFPARREERKFRREEEGCVSVEGGWESVAGWNPMEFEIPIDDLDPMEHALCQLRVGYNSLRVARIVRIA